MGLQIRLLFTDSKEKLNVVVEDVDKNTKKCKRTMLDVMVDVSASFDEESCNFVIFSHDIFVQYSVFYNLPKSLIDDLGNFHEHSSS